MTTATRSRIPGWVLALAGAGVLALVVLIAVLTTGEAGDRVTAEELAGSPTVEGEALPLAGDPAQDPAVGEPSPVVEGEGFDGTTITVGEPGQPELLVFMASWCPHCQDELPELVELIEQDRVPDGVRMTTVVTGLDENRDNWPPDAWLEEEGWTNPVLVDDVEATVAEAFGQPGTPYFVAIDGEGQIAVRVSGRLPQAMVANLLEDLAAGA
jgi:cytochrome c biogenesis protein CcmG, thiol:disulfide interchange protein DsbE